jgi:threonine dehydratase
MWIADHPQHCKGAATIGLELVETVPSFYTVLIALGGGAVGHRRGSS